MDAWNCEICDVTLRDGEQTPGVTFSCGEKKEIASMLDAIGIEVIEAGFPVVSEAEHRCVAEIAAMGLDARICCLARALPSDVKAAAECGVDMVSIFIATSDLHIRHKYRKPREEVLEGALSMVELAHDLGMEVRFAAEDASRTELSFLEEMYTKGADCGAMYSSYADTVGCLTPLEIAKRVRELALSVPNKICIHCHNDMGLASANTITAAECGAFQLHTTVNGIGERAGNATLAEVLIGLRMKGGIDRYDLTLLPALSEMVEKASGILNPATKPVVGKNAFAHESGIHIAALLEDPETYEYVPPAFVGAERNFILGKHTGRKAVAHVVRCAGQDISDEEIDLVLHRIKEISEGKCSITPEMLCRIIKEIKEVQ